MVARCLWMSRRTPPKSHLFFMMQAWAKDPMQGLYIVPIIFHSVPAGRTFKRSFKRGLFGLVTVSHNSWTVAPLLHAGLPQLLWRRKFVCQRPGHFAFPSNFPTEFPVIWEEIMPQTNPFRLFTFKLCNCTPSSILFLFACAFSCGNRSNPLPFSSPSVYSLEWRHVCSLAVGSACCIRAALPDPWIVGYTRCLISKSNAYNHTTHPALTLLGRSDSSQLVTTSRGFIWTFPPRQRRLCLGALQPGGSGFRLARQSWEPR